MYLLSWFVWARGATSGPAVGCPGWAPEEGRETMARVVFVCSGNTCRSPLAAALFERAARRRGLQVDATSAGVFAKNEERASEGALSVAGEWGLDLAGHRARRLEREDIAGAELVLTMEKTHKQQVIEVAPETAGRVFTLAEYAGSELGDVQDPYHGPIETYRATARVLEDLAERAVQRFEREHGRPRSRVAVGWDHAGAILRQAVVQALESLQLGVVEFGPNAGESADYPLVARDVARAVASGEAAFGVLLCGTGIGMSMAANKVRGVRAALCHDPYSARMARAHNDANVLAMGGRVVGPALAVEVVRAFAQGRFEGGRHGRRVDQMIDMEQTSC